MKYRSVGWYGGPALAVLGLAWSGGAADLSANEPVVPIVVYATGFETWEGFDAHPDLALVGQGDWIGWEWGRGIVGEAAGAGGNGLVTDFFAGRGQQAYIGFHPLDTPGADTLNIWRPINLSPIDPERPIVTFSVTMHIADSQNEMLDDFRWSVYNTSGLRLFTLDFDNSSKLISYALDDDRFSSTGHVFDNVGDYHLLLTMNFERNLWIASLNGIVVVNSQPITTQEFDLDLGDIDAVWAVRRRESPGDNFMVFDNYKIVAEALPSIPPTVEQMGFTESGQFLVRIYGEQGLNYAVEGSTDLKKWDSLKMFRAPSGGILDFEDPAAAEVGQRFYRARQAP